MNDFIDVMSVVTPQLETSKETIKYDDESAARDEMVDTTRT